MRRIAALSLLLLVATACGNGDSAVTTLSPDLTVQEETWCAFVDGSDESAFRFDLIFEIGLAEGLNMDAVNATATARLGEYIESGLSEDDAILAVSRDLFANPTFVEACRAAFAEFGG